MNEEHFLLGKIEEPRVPWIEEREKKLDEFIATSAELQARIQTLKSTALSTGGFLKMIESWNSEHQEWGGPYVERIFNGAHGEVLMIRMNKAGNVRLSGYYNEKPEERR